MSVRRIFSDVIQSEISAERRRSFIKIRRKSERKERNSIGSESKDTEVDLSSSM